MRWRTLKFPALRLIGVALVACGLSGQTAQADTQSSHVAYMGSLSVQNGGAFPSTIVPFNSFVFHQVTKTTLSLAILGPGGVCGATKCDTVLLNVASSSGTGGLACNVNVNLTAQQKADLVTFVQQGGKLIIYDSECVPQNYSWLPFPFTTNNPGARGGTGTANIVEDNALSSPVTADPQYINAGILGSQTDAIGDMNVMTTQHPDWCLDISGTNVNQVTGPVHTYARYGNGLIIYNGMDVDVMGAGTAPNAALGPGNLSKIWLQELQVAFNPTPLADLPCGVAVIGLSITPLTAINDLSKSQNSHTVTGTLKDQAGNGQPGHTLTFTITSGPNAGATGTCGPVTCATPASGEVMFTYASNGSTGIDSIQVCTPNDQNVQICSQTAKKEWITGAALVCDVDLDGDVDRNDINVIFAARGTRVQPGDPRDLDGDGLITVNDARGCVLRCTRPNCAP